MKWRYADLPDGVAVRIKGCPQHGAGVCPLLPLPLCSLCCVSEESETLSSESGGLSVNPCFIVCLLCSLGKLLKVSGLLFAHL